MQELTTSGSSVGRLHHLDALRGLAATVVVFNHLRTILTWTPAPWIFTPFLAGGKCVVLFFVLSGYVLSLPFWVGKQLSYGPYLTRRICRIYLPYLGAALLAAYFASKFGGAKLPLTPTYYDTWHEPITRKLILHQLVFGSGAITPQPLSMAFWSLKFEMAISFFFPLLCWALRGPTLIGLAAALALDFEGARLPGDFGGLVMYTGAFMIGALAAKERERIYLWFRGIGTPMRYVLLVLVVLGFYAGESKNFINIPAAAGVIVIADCSRARRWLSMPFFVYLGKISYSLYLLHGTALFLCFTLLYTKVPLPIVISAYLVTAFTAAHFYSKYVEESSIALGRRLTRGKGRKLKPEAITQPASNNPVHPRSSDTETVEQS